LSLSGAGSLKHIIENPGIKYAEIATFTVPKANLPGQFVLCFDYEKKEGSAPYPSKHYFFR